jgi:hypothetical protein
MSSTGTLSLSLEDSLSSLNHKTEAMLRTMRFDMLLLGSRGEEMRRLLDRLEAQYELLERMLENADAKDEEQKDANIYVAERRAKRKSSVASATIDWNATKSECGDGKNVKFEHMGGSVIETRGVSSAATPAAAGFGPRPGLRSLRSISKSQVLKGLGSDNFDWDDNDGASDEEDVKVVDSKSISNNRGENDNPRGVAGWLKNGNVGVDKCTRTSSSEKTNTKDSNENSGGWRPFLFFNPRSSDTAIDTASIKPRQRLSKSLPPPSSTTLYADESNANLEEAKEEGESTKSSTDNGFGRASMLKLNGLDMASSTLHQLLSYRRRSLCDLRYQQAILQSTSSFTEQVEGFQVDKLRSKLHFAKVERRRKMQTLEDIRSKITVSADQEERLRGELESVHAELCRLRREMDYE